MFFLYVIFVIQILILPWNALLSSQPLKSSDKNHFLKDILNQPEFSHGNPLLTKHHNVTIYKTGKCCDGYTLLSVRYPHSIYLIDMNGTIINKWNKNNINPHPAKILSNGSIISGLSSPTHSYESSELVQFNWLGNIEWNCSHEFDKQDEYIGIRQHHDYQRQGNPVGYYAPGQNFCKKGKTLILAHETTRNASVSIWRLEADDLIFEVNWNGTPADFKWLASNHINEIGFNILSRIGIWLNPGSPGYLLFLPPGDLFHINSVSYLGQNKWYDKGYKEFNPENIIISSRHANFIAIIDKKTKDIVWKVGPQFQENNLDQIIGPHHAHMIPKGLPGEGNILVFDNGGISGYGLLGGPNQYRPYSKVIEFNPITFNTTWQYQSKNGSIFFEPNNHKFLSPVSSSAQRLPNGNTLITEAISSRVFEVTSEHEIVWEYYSQLGCRIYRSYRIPPDWIPENPSNYRRWT